MTWETILKGVGKTDPRARKAAFRRAVIRAAREAGPDFFLKDIHQPFLKYYGEELSQITPMGYGALVKKFKEFPSFQSIVGSYFVKGEEDKGSKLLTYNLKPEDREE
jgi:hypothetical protein